MATQSLQPQRVRLCMEGGVDIYRDEIATALSGLASVPVDEAEHLVAVAGEDERQYALRVRAGVFNTLCRRIDEFLADDDGGYYLMRVYLASHERSEAVLEIWFQVTRPGATTRGTWFRHLVVGVDDRHVYADIGGPSKAAEGRPAP